MTFNEFLETLETDEERERWEQLDNVARAYLEGVDNFTTTDPEEVSALARSHYIGKLPRTGNDHQDIAELLLELLGGVESLSVETLREFFDVKRWGREQSYYYDIATIENDENGRQDRYLFRL